MNDTSDGSLPAHYERCLGPIAEGWSDRGQQHGVQIVRFDAQSRADISTFATLGLSRHILKQPSGTAVRQELLLSARAEHESAAVAAFLLCLAEIALEHHQALLCGEVIGPGAPVIKQSKLTAVYVTNLSPFDDALRQFNGEPSPIIFPTIVPVTSAEASLIRARGWRWFDEQIQAQDLDLWDLLRTSEIAS